MKNLAFILIVLCQACINQNSVDNNQGNESTTQDSVYQTEEGIKTYVPKTNKQQSYISQKDVIMNEAVAISNDFYNSLKSQNYAGANKYMQVDALIVTPVNEWNKIYQKAREKKGQLGFIKMYDYGVKLKMNGSNDLGDYAELIFDAQYKDGNMREKLTFFRKDSTDAVKIMAYEYDEIVDNIKVSPVFR